MILLTGYWHGSVHLSVSARVGRVHWLRDDSETLAFSKYFSVSAARCLLVCPRLLRLVLRLLRLLLVLLEHRILRRRAELRLLGLLLLDVVERHADDRLLHLRALLRALLPGLLSLALLVLPAPVLRPRQLHRLDALAVKADHLVVEEKLDLPIPLAEADPAARVDAVPHLQEFSQPSRKALSSCRKSSCSRST